MNIVSLVKVTKSYDLWFNQLGGLWLHVKWTTKCLAWEGGREGGREEGGRRGEEGEGGGREGGRKGGMEGGKGREVIHDPKQRSIDLDIIVKGMLLVFMILI